MPVKRKLNRKVTKVPRNVKINSKSSKRASQKKRGRSVRKSRGRKSQSGGLYFTMDKDETLPSFRGRCGTGAARRQLNCGLSDKTKVINHKDKGYICYC